MIYFIWLKIGPGLVRPLAGPSIINLTDLALVTMKIGYSENYGDYIAPLGFGKFLGLLRNEV